MRSAITPVLAITALISAALAPRVYAHLGPQQKAPDATLTPTSLPQPDLSAADGVQVKVQLDRSHVLAGGSLRAQLTLVTPDEGADATVLPSDVVLVLDTSGSMGGEKLVDAKRAAHTLLNQLGKRDRAAIIDFDSGARVAVALQPVDRRAHDAIDVMGAGGGTNMAEGLQTGLEAMGRAESGRSRRVVLLSDGHPDSASGLRALAGRFGQLEAPLTTVGVGANYDPMLMQDLADAGTGNFYWAGPNMALDQVFADEFRAARSRFASDTRLQGRLGEGVRLTGVSGYAVAKGSVALGDLFAGQQRTLFVDVMVPNSEGAVDLGALELSWTGLDGEARGATVALGSVEVTAKPALVAANLDADVWERSVVQEEYNAVRKMVSSALASGDRQQAQAALQGYRLRNGALNEVVGSVAVVDNLVEVESLEEQIRAGAIDQKGVVDLATQSYQSRRSGQAYAY